MDAQFDIDITPLEMGAAPQLIKAKRQRLGMTQKELADVLGLPRYGERTIRRWECGETKPSMPELRAVLSLVESVPFPNPDLATVPYKMIDIFAGIGGTRLGFYQTGKVGVVFTSEINKFAVKTYQANFGGEVAGDITQVQADAIADHDILVAGFPCQAFSQAGLKRGFADTRGTMFFEVARILKAKRPKAFLLENVRNLLTHDHGQTFAVIAQTLQDLGYEIHYQVLSSKDFGVPQNRVRIYIVGFATEQVSKASRQLFSFPPAVQGKTRVGDILEDLSAELVSKYTISDLLWSGHQKRKERNKAAGKGFGYSLFNAESPYTNTISARYYKDGSEILIEQQGHNPRKITPREAARLQGFPEDYLIVVSDCQAYKQFGNSVSVPVIHAIAEQMMRVLDHERGKRAERLA